LYRYIKKKNIQLTVLSHRNMSSEMEVIESEYVTSDVQVISIKTQYELLRRVVEIQSHITPNQCMWGGAEEALVSSRLLRFSEKRAPTVRPLLLNKSRCFRIPSLLQYPSSLSSAFASFSMEKDHLFSSCPCLLNQGTTTTPILPACATTLLATPSRLKPPNLSSPCLILAIS